MNLVIVESRPVQYRAPVYQKLNQLRPGTFEVLYAGNSSVKGYHDLEFGTYFAWDVDLLSGYPSYVLGTERARTRPCFGSFGGRGVYTYLRRNQPRALLMHTLAYEYDWAVYLSALCLGIFLWIRVETQDEASVRGPFKSVLRRNIYRLIYRCVKRGYFIGQLNRQHLLRHGVSPERLWPAHYCTPNPLRDLSTSEKLVIRNKKRKEFAVEPDDLVVGFAGKLISKKNPELLLEMAEEVSVKTGRRIVIWFAGSGELEESLKSAAHGLECRANVRVLFHGFVNQSTLFTHYLAMDVFVLPSRRMGETWGLVVNEALQAGCSVVVSEAVGCGADFVGLERFKVIPIGDRGKLADSVMQHSRHERDFGWALEFMTRYSVAAAAASLAEGIDEVAAESHHAFQIQHQR